MKMNNFHVLMAIVSAFSNSAVGRLKWTRARLPRKILEQLEGIEALMSVEGNLLNNVFFLGCICYIL